MTITFERLKTSHFPLLLRWLEAPHVKHWWDKDVHWTEARIADKYSHYVRGVKRLTLPEGVIEKPMHAFIIGVDSVPIGYIQYYNKQDFPPEHGYDTTALPPNCAAIDWYIGELAYTGQGIGPRALETFLTEHVFPYFDHVFVDPDTANGHAVRAYEKAGFAGIKQVNGGEITWMIRSKK